MSNFNNVYSNCPICNTRVSFQSKVSGLHDYALTRVPIEIAVSLDGDEKICSCGYKVIIRLENTPALVSMIIDQTKIRCYTPRTEVSDET